MKELKIINSGSEQFPFYQVMNGEDEFCATNSMEKAELIKQALNTRTRQHLTDEWLEKLYDKFCGWYRDDGSYDETHQANMKLMLSEWIQSQQAETSEEACR